MDAVLTIPPRSPSASGSRSRHDDGSYIGYEDFCVLNGLPTADKYKADTRPACFVARVNLIAIEHRARF